MKIANLLSTAALVAALGIAAPALAETTFDSTSGGGPADQTGLTTLGIDITRAGSTPDSVHQFIAGLNVEAQQSVISGCQTAVANPVSYAGSVISFCENAIGAGATTPMLGFAPLAPQVSPAQPYEMPVLQPDSGEPY